MSDEIKPEVIKKTQKTLGKYVKKPPLTDKLLTKPPFRFLHDVIKAVIKETGFLKGLFNEDELNSNNVKDKDSKVAFLNKLIDAVKIITNTELAVKSSKIVAGLEPQETNLLLQTIAKALDKKLDTKEYVQKLNSGGASKKKTSTTKVSKPEKVNKSPSVETPKSTERTKSKISVKAPNKEKSKEKTKSEKPKKKSSDTNKDVDETQKNNNKDPETTEAITKPGTPKKSEIVIPESKEELQNLPEFNLTPNNAAKITKIENIADINTDKETHKEKIESQVFKRQNSVVRPKSARPKSGDRVQITAAKVELESNVEEPQKQPSTNNRPKSSLRPPSVRPSSARPGAPRLRPDSALPVHEPITMGNINVIIENVDLADDEETVTIENNDDVNQNSSDLKQIQLSQDNKGHLVEQILEQIQESGDSKGNTDVWESESVTVQGKDSTAKDIQQIQSLIQNLTKTANPLGKIMNYLHEDVEAMHTELQMWLNTKKQLYMEINKQQRMSAESNKPLLVQLEKIQQEVKKQEQEIANYRSIIFKNDQRIKELLSK